ncbi:YALIA101S05e08570g1_1 [Yarrowia lipolytica]|jgi:hypothetical protein|nr:Hypothetical protein YALI2_E01594g [Yarrowia lipolytica]SEI34696.1 YALIA101S05e08570g1_1 [Yarrowia lipolytica]VBB78971.1 Hypothetical protein conserved in the Yarrowia clade [Yarrowia lipolytica]
MTEPNTSSTLSLPYTRGYDRVIIDSKDLAQTGRVSDNDLLLALSHTMNRSVDNIKHRLDYLSGLDESQIKRIRHARYPSTIDWESLFTFLSDRNWSALRASSNSRDNVWAKFDPIEDVLLLYHVYTSTSLHDAIDQLGQQFPHRLKKHWRSRYTLLKNQYSPEQLETRMKDAERMFILDTTLAYFQQKFPRFYSTNSDPNRPWFDEDDKDDDEGDADGPQTMFSSSEDKFILDTNALFASKRVPDRLLLKILEFVLSIGPYTIRKHLAELRQESEMVTLALKESALPENVDWPKFESAIMNLDENSTVADLKWPEITEAVSWEAGKFSTNEDRCLMAHLEVAATIFDGARAVHRKYPHKSLQQWHKRYYRLLADKGSVSKTTRIAAARFSERESEELFVEQYPDVYRFKDNKFSIIGEEDTVVEEPQPEPPSEPIPEHIPNPIPEPEEVLANVPRPQQTLPSGYDTSKFTRTQDKVIYAANKTATENNVTIEVLVQTVSYVLNRDPELVRQRLVTITTEMSQNEIARLQRHNYPYGIDWHQIKDFLISAQSKPKEAVDWNELYTRSRAFNVKKRLDDKERKALLAIAHSEKTPVAAMMKLHSLYPHRSRHAWSDSLRILKSKPNYLEEVRVAKQEYDHVTFKEHFTKSFPEYYGAKEVIRTVVDNNHNPKGKPRTEGSRYPLKPLKSKRVHVDEPNAESEKSLPAAPTTSAPKKSRKKRTKLLKDEAEQLKAEDLIRTVVQDAVDEGHVDPKDPAAADGLRPRRKRKAAAQIGSLAEAEIEEHDEQLSESQQSQQAPIEGDDMSMMDLSVDSINEEDLMRAVQNATNSVDDHILMEPNVVDVAVAAAAMRPEPAEEKEKRDKDEAFVPEDDDDEEEEMFN